MAHDGDVVLVAGKDVDVVLDTLQGQDLVEQAQVTDAVALNLAAQLFGGQEAKVVETVVDHDGDDGFVERYRLGYKV